MDWTKHLCFNDRTSHSDMRVLLTSSSLRVRTHTQMVTQMHVCDGVQWVPVSDLLTCWRAAQGLLIFLCDPNIHYTNLFWALTMCKALFFLSCGFRSEQFREWLAFSYFLVSLDPGPVLNVNGPFIHSSPYLENLIFRSICLFTWLCDQINMYVNRHLYSQIWEAGKHIHRALGENWEESWSF